jgi:Co/Zn/Cd efflux system component
VPEGLDVEELERKLIKNVPSFFAVHELHVWTLTAKQVIFTSSSKNNTTVFAVHELHVWALTAKQDIFTLEIGSSGTFCPVSMLFILGHSRQSKLFLP